MLKHYSLALFGGLAFFLSPIHQAAAQRIEADYGDLNIRLAGRFHYDMLLDTDVVKRNQTEEDWRRARLSLRLKWQDDWRFAASVDFPDGDAEVRNLRFEYRGWPVYLAVGRMQDPFGLSTSSSSNYLALMERPLATEIGPRFGTGIRANYRYKRMQVTAGAFGKTVAGFDFEEDDVANGDMYGVRSSAKLIHNREYLIHAGASFSHRDPDENSGLRFAQRPETILVDGLNISHPRIFDVDKNISYGFEFALRNNRRMLQGEYMHSRVTRFNGAEDLNFEGFYVEGSWALTGERRPYSTRFGVFGGIKPKNPVTRGGFGAWELAARFSYLDLRDEVVPGDFEGEAGEVATIGLNWYLTNQARLMINALHIKEQRGSFEDDGTVLQARLQYRF